MNLRLVICLGLALLAGSAHTANASCSFKSRDVIFPQDLFYFQEASPDHAVDDNVTVRIFFDKTKMSGANRYYLLNEGQSKKAIVAGGNDTPLGDQSGLTGDAELGVATDNDLVYKTVTMETPVHSECSVMDCKNQYRVTLEIGAAPDVSCAGFGNSGRHAGRKGIYVRAFYHFTVDVSYERVNGVVDFSAWSDVLATQQILVTQQDVERENSFSAKNIQSVDDFKLFSYLGAENDFCLGENTVNQNTTYNTGHLDGTNSAPFTSYTLTDDDDVGLSSCVAGAYAYMVQNDMGTGSTTGSDDDIDAESTAHNMYNDGGYVKLHLSQYSQMGDNEDNNNEITTVTKPTSPAFAVGSTAEAKKSGGADFRLDVCTTAGHTDGATPQLQVETDGASDLLSDILNVTITANGDLLQTGHSIDSGLVDKTVEFANTHRTEIHDQGKDVAGRDGISALAICGYQIQAPESCTGGSDPDECTYSPDIYLAAWFEQNVPTEADYAIADHSTHNSTSAATPYNVDNVSGLDETVEGNTTVPDNDASRDPSPDGARRLRGVPLLRAAVQQQEQPKTAKRVHFMHVRLAHHM